MTTTTSTLQTDGATIVYDVRPARRDAGHRPLLVVGSPMDAGGFVALAQELDDRTTVTYDPRGAARSTRTGDGPSTPDQHAADLAAVIEAVGAPADVFASSGGAINALELVVRRPELVGTLVAHEPPLASALPDRDLVVRACQVIHEVYQERGQGAGTAAFMALTMHEGEVTEEVVEGLRAADPAAMGLPSEDDGSRDDVLLAQNLLTSSPHQLDVAAVAAAPTRVLVAGGTASGEQLAVRAARGLAAQLGQPVTDLPGHHIGFAPVEWGMGSDPAGFAAALREVLDS